MWLVEIVFATVSLFLCVRAYRANWLNSKAMARYPNSQARCVTFSS
jgi:hypothetical protein